MRRLDCILLAALLAAGCLERDSRYCASSGDCPGRYPYCDVVKRECEATPPDGFAPLDLHVGDLEEPGDGAPDAALDEGVDLREPPDLAPRCRAATDCPSVTEPICDPVAGACRPCAGSADDPQCAAHADGRRLCDPASHLCVECNGDSDCATSTRPVCDNHACRGCRSNGECPALALGAGWPTVGLCQGDGSCARASDAAFVDNSAACTVSASPFCELADAVAASGKSILVVRGSGTMYQKAVTISSTVGTLSILGPGPSASPTAQLSQNGQAAFTVATTGVATATVIVDGLDLIGSAGATKKDGVDCSQLGGTTTLTLRNSLVHDSGAIGVSSSSCSLIVTGNVIGANAAGGLGNAGGVGVNVTGGTVIADANIISGNGRGGLAIAAGATYTITNNIIAGNGSSSDPLSSAGVSIDSTSTSTGFAFNTVVKNHVQTGVGGVECGVGATKPILDSVVWDNDTSTTSQLGAQCASTNVVAGAGSAAGSPVFTSDFHLQAGASGNTACCADKITAPGTPNSDHDVDFTARPKGAAYDVGAHELQ